MPDIGKICLLIFEAQKNYDENISHPFQKARRWKYFLYLIAAKLGENMYLYIISSFLYYHFNRARGFGVKNDTYCEAGNVKKFIVAIFASKIFAVHETRCGT